MQVDGPDSVVCMRIHFLWQNVKWSDLVLVCFLDIRLRKGSGGDGLEGALDQIGFMSSLLNVDGLLKRILGYVDRQTVLGELQPESGYLLREVLLCGEAARITEKPERTARRILKNLLDKKLLSAETEKGSVRLALYPEGG